LVIEEMVMSSHHLARLGGAFVLLCAAALYAQTNACAQTNTTPAPPGTGPASWASEKADAKKVDKHESMPQVSEPAQSSDLQKADEAAHGSAAAAGNKPSN
jgi:hypothetical protein